MEDKKNCIEELIHLDEYIRGELGKLETAIENNKGKRDPTSVMYQISWESEARLMKKDLMMIKALKHVVLDISNASLELYKLKGVIGKARPR